MLVTIDTSLGSTSSARPQQKMTARCETTSNPFGRLYSGFLCLMATRVAKDC